MTVMIPARPRVPSEMVRIRLLPPARWMMPPPRGIAKPEMLTGCLRTRTASAMVSSWAGTGHPGWPLADVTGAHPRPGARWPGTARPLPSAFEPGGPRLQIAALGEAGGEPRGPLVAGAGRVMLPGHLQQVRTHRVEPVVAGHPVIGVQRREQVEAGLRPVRHRDGDGAIECDHGPG